MLHSSSSPSIPISATFLCLLAASVGTPFVAADENNVTIDDLYQKIAPTAALPGFNVDGGSVFTNYADLVNNGQFFFIWSVSLVNEKPASEPVKFSALRWCSDLTFSDLNTSSLIGYAGRCVGMFLATAYADLLESGAQLPIIYSEVDYTYTAGISAVFVEQQNIFEGQTHTDTDDWVFRYWDDGRKTSPLIAWEGHDEGDMNPNAGSSSFSAFAELTWMSVEEVAQLFNASVDEFTPETFKQVYLDTWIKDHEEEAAIENPYPEAELEIIEQVKNETNSADDTANAAPAPVQPDSPTEEGDNSDGANPVEDDSGSGRQLVSVGARLVSAALRVFGI